MAKADFENVSELRHRTMSHIRSRDTSIEVKLRKELWSRGYRYRKNWKALPGTPDIALTKYKIAVFCDSEFFHGKDWEIIRPRVERGNNGAYWVEKIEKNMARDAAKDQALLARGWTVVHFWGREIMKDPEECVRVIEEAMIQNLKMGEVNEGR